MIIKNTLNKYCLSCTLCLASFIFFAQTKSTTTQTIDGKPYYIHTIEKGQSLYSISKLYNVSLDDLYATNPELKTGVKANQEIKILNNTVPNKTVATNNTNNNALLTYQVDTLKYFTYKITKGETIYSITKKFNLTEAKLRQLNKLAEGEVVLPRQRIFLN